eukprot:gene5538-biopygen12197
MQARNGKIKRESLHGDTLLYLMTTGEGAAATASAAEFAQYPATSPTLRVLRTFVTSATSAAMAASAVTAMTSAASAKSRVIIDWSPWGGIWGAEAAARAAPPPAPRRRRPRPSRRLGDRRGFPQIQRSRVALPLQTVRMCAARRRPRSSPRPRPRRGGRGAADRPAARPRRVLLLSVTFLGCLPPFGHIAGATRELAARPRPQRIPAPRHSRGGEACSRKWGGARSCWADGGGLGPPR